MKKIICLIISVILITMIIPFQVNAETADNDLIQDGTYIQLGKYNDDPILWRCVSTDDENGKLIVSDRILCYKCFDSPRDVSKYGYDYRFGNGFWPESNLRTWLNSDETGGNIVWPGENPPHENVAYDNEDGFLSDRNFTDGELSVLKSVSQWLILSSDNKDKVTNGYMHFFATNTNSVTRQYQEMNNPYTDISQLSHVEGAMCRTNDTMFLLDETQIYSLWSKYDAYSEPTEKALAQYSSVWDISEPFNNPIKYWIRTGAASSARIITGSSGYTYSSAFAERGVRPAFYLNEDNVRVISGSGVWNDPYVVDGYGQEVTAVFSQGKQLVNAQISSTNGEIMVFVRDVFESFGAEVKYYDVDDGIITASSDERTVVLQAGNPEIGNGTDVFKLNTAPAIINDRAMISLEGVEEAYECTTEYIENLDRIVIDKPAPQVFDDGYGHENWQQYRAIENGTYHEQFDLYVK